MTNNKNKKSALKNQKSVNKEIDNPENKFIKAICALMTEFEKSALRRRYAVKRQMSTNQT